jgi:hypothetical protein
MAIKRRSSTDRRTRDVPPATKLGAAIGVMGAILLISLLAYIYRSARTDPDIHLDDTPKPPSDGFAAEPGHEPSPGGSVVEPAQVPYSGGWVIGPG